MVTKIKGLMKMNGYDYFCYGFFFGVVFSDKGIRTIKHMIRTIKHMIRKTKNKKADESLPTDK